MKHRPNRVAVEFKYKKHRQYYSHKIHTTAHEFYEVIKNPTKNQQKEYVKQAIALMQAQDLFFKKPMSKMNMKEMLETMETAHNLLVNN